MYAIKPNGVGQQVAARRIMPDWPMVSGEAFTVDHWQTGMVLADDEQSLRYLTDSEKSEEETADWHARIQSRADTELQRGVSVTIDGTTYGIRTGPQALALIDGAAIRADVAARNGETVSRRVPTDQGIVQFDGPALWQIFEAVESHQQAVSSRAEELEAMVVDGIVTESDLDSGWP